MTYNHPMLSANHTKKLLLLLIGLLFIAHLPTFGQRTVSVSATISPVYTYTWYRPQFLFPDSDGQLVEPVLLKGKGGSVGYLTGLTINYVYDPNWSVTTGGWFHSLASRRADPLVATPTTKTIRYRAIRIPILFNYRPFTRRLSPYYSGGLLLDYQLPGRVIVRVDGQRTQTLNLTFSGGLTYRVAFGAGFSYRLDRRWTLMSQLMSNYNLGKFGEARTHNRAVELNLLTQLAYSLR